MTAVRKHVSSLSKLHSISLALYLATFAFVMLKDPVLGNDSFSYNVMEISRFPGYAVFMRVLLKIFGVNLYTHIIILIHVLFGLTAIHVFTNKLNQIFKLTFVQNIGVLLLLLFPFFTKPLLANDVASEGICYPLYLLIITYSIKVVFQRQFSKIYFLALLLIALTITRGQFIIVPIIIAFIFILKERHRFRKKPQLTVIILLLLVPFVTNMLDKSYRKMVHGHFVKTPYSYVNAVALPLFVSKKDDFKTLKNEDYKEIFKFSYQRIDSLNLLNSKVEGSLEEKYMRFHENFPLICNQNIHMGGVDYYMNKGFSRAEAYIKTEEACKAIMFNAIKHNFKDYILIYYTNVIYGFKSVFIALFFLITALWSFVKVIKKFELDTGFILFTSLLVISNALIVAIACHSISRYLVYNYFSIIIIPLLLIRRLPFFKNS